MSDEARIKFMPGVYQRRQVPGEQEKEFQARVYEELRKLTQYAWEKRLARNLASDNFRNWWIQAEEKLEEFRDQWDLEFGR